MTKELQRLERKIDKLIEKAYRPLWVKASVVTGLTQWNAEGMRQARENGYIEYKTIETGEKKEFWYNLNSLDSRFIKRTA